MQKIEAEGTIELLCRFNIIESRFNDSCTSLLFVSSETESHPKINCALFLGNPTDTGKALIHALAASSGDIGIVTT
jgi:hypothetical protein